MKKLLFSALLLAGFAFVAPSAEAGHNRRVLVGYDRCGHPVYREVCSSDYYRPSYSYAPARYGRSYDYDRNYDYGRYDRGNCSSSHRSSRSRFAVTFGF